jgi:hypothetical protein
MVIQLSNAFRYFINSAIFTTNKRKNTKELNRWLKMVNPSMVTYWLLGPLRWYQDELR